MISDEEFEQNFGRGLACKEYGEAKGGFCVVEFRIKFRFLLWAFVEFTRILDKDTGNIKPMSGHAVIFMSGVGYFALEAV